MQWQADQNKQPPVTAKTAIRCMPADDQKLAVWQTQVGGNTALQPGCCMLCVLLPKQCLTDTCHAAQALISKYRAVLTASGRTTGSRRCSDRRGRLLELQSMLRPPR